MNSISPNHLSRPAFLCSKANYVLEKGLTITLLVTAILGAAGAMQPSYYMYTMIGLCAGLVATKVSACCMHKQGSSIYSKLITLNALVLTIVGIVKYKFLLLKPWGTYGMIAGIVFFNLCHYHKVLSVKKKADNCITLLNRVIANMDNSIESELDSFDKSLKALKIARKQLHSFERILMDNYFSRKTADGRDKLRAFKSQIDNTEA